MYEKCISCERLGKDCFPNLYVMDVEEIRKWAKLRQKYKGWTYADLSEASGVPQGTISSSFSKKGGDVNYTTFATMLRALVGGEPGESPCPNFSADVPLLQEEIVQLEQDNEALKEQVGNAEGVRRDDIKTTKAEKQKTIDSLKQDLQFCQNQILHKDQVIKQCKAKQARIFWFSFIGFVLYLLLFDLPYPDAGLIRSEAFHEILEIIGNALATGSTVNTALLTVIQWLIFRLHW